MSNSVHQLLFPSNDLFDIRHLFGFMIMIFDTQGGRKYLTVAEREAFIARAGNLAPAECTFCLTLAYTGARISEVLTLTPLSFDLETGSITIESLKKRQHGVFRAVPVPQFLFDQMENAYQLKDKRHDPQQQNLRIWGWSRTTAWKKVKQPALDAGIAPIRATPKALRHAFGVGAIQKGVPLNILRKWMGHARIETTAIYADAVGDEERALAARMWGS